jgi:hypothetical protein
MHRRSSAAASASCSGSAFVFALALGTIRIAEGGKAVLAVKPIRDGWQPINLRSVRLEPAN